ncbi:hypothetical protein [Sulfuracidifex tepidarius]|uniref:Uncharacterized protein n=1 Tax=Sulfuracidifex tepidarius TaxID=1294262 RepID=A0A510E5V8_9CREN|nr:hypothetical protein [Sulfuracidifex tepidarius]BBG27807.1 hypothetical protein IC007_2361 [Sulfuracidifex tepidarius]
MPESHPLIPIKYNLTKIRPKIKVNRSNSFSLIFREVEKEDNLRKVSFHSAVELGFTYENRLVSIFMEILDLPEGMSKEKFNSLLCTLLLDNAYLEPYYVELYFIDSDYIPNYRRIIANTEMSIIENVGLAKLEFDIEKSYMKIDKLMGILQRLQGE